MPTGKQIAREIFQRTLGSIDIPGVMGRKLYREGSRLVLPGAFLDFSTVNEVKVVAIGKAAHAMVSGFLPLLPSHVSCRGVVAAPTSPAASLRGLRYFQAGHPLPDQYSWKAAEAILELLQNSTEQTAIFFLLSGGGSALVELPLDPTLGLSDVQDVHRALVTCGAPIDAMNTVRRHLSAVKGGRLATAAGRAKKITLAVTDVPAGKEAALASGPSLPDPTTKRDVEEIVRNFGLREKFPARVVKWIDAGHMPETPKPGDLVFEEAVFILLLGLDDLFHAAHHATESHGFLTECDNATDDWPIERAADYLLGCLDTCQKENPGRRIAIIADGEVSSPVTGNGIGGRNSAFVLHCAGKIAGRKITVISAGTDGVDGNSPAAGAVADGETIVRAKALGLDAPEFFRRSDAFSFFDKLGDAIITGPTGNNLRDLRVLLSEP
jgi:glycerate 2-kinase